MFEPLLSPLFSSLFSRLIAAAQRIFITVNGVDEYFTFQNTKTFPNDFDLSIDAALPTAATTVTLFGQTASADHYIKVLSTGFVSINIDTSVVTSTVLATKDSKQRRYGVKLIGNDFIFTEDGATIDTVTDAVAAAKTLIINALCQSNGADFFNRTASDPILTDLTTASNSVSWKLGNPTGNTEQAANGSNLLTYVNIDADARELFTFNQSANKWDGSIQRVVNGNFSDGLTGWADVQPEASVVEGELHCDGQNSSTTFMVQQDILGAAVGLKYDVGFTITQTDGGSASFYLGDDAGGFFYETTIGTFSNTMAIGAGGICAIRVTVGTEVTFDNLSVKRILEVAT